MDTWDDLHAVVARAVRASGGGAATAQALASATVEAERHGRAHVGVAHLFDMLDGLVAGRINPDPVPRVVESRASALTVDADGGVAQVAFAHARDRLVAAAASNGVAVAAFAGCYTVGELGFYPRELAKRGQVAIGGANSPSLMSVYGSSSPITGTNPIAFALPGSPPRVIDQAASAAAWVSVRAAAAEGKALDDGVALDANGQPTTDAVAALDGALLPAGGIKGANMAMMVELLAVLAGANFSVDAPSFNEGADSPGVGMWLMAIDAAAFDPSYVERVDRYLGRLAPEIGHDFGRRRPLLERPDVPDELLLRLRKAASGDPGRT